MDFILNYAGMFSNCPPGFLSNFLWTQVMPLPVPTADFTGKTVIITGANTGLGLEAARHFTRLGAAKVILGCRSTEKAEVAKSDIESTTKTAGVVEVWPIDLTSFESVKQFCKRAETLERLDIVVANAAALSYGEFRTDEGYDTLITVNVISNYLMALLLLPKLRQTAAQFNVQPNLTVVSSVAHIVSHFEERHALNIFDEFKSEETMKDDRYNTSKLLVLLVAKELAKSMDERGNNPIVLNAPNPGLCKSELFRSVRFPVSWVLGLGLALIGRTREMGSRTLLGASTAGKESHGKYMDACKVGKESQFSTSDEGAKTQKRVYAELMAILEDLQESWEPMLDRVKTVSDGIQIANGVLATLSVRPEKMTAALNPFMLAIDVADYLVRKVLPFRETHHISGRCVAKSEETGTPMNEFSVEQMKAIDEQFEEDIADTFNYESSVEARLAKGGTSRSSVLEQIKVLRAMLG